jgi:hypothetical protein
MSGVYGFSVQYAPGQSVEDLARAGQFPHSQISSATDDDLAAALLRVGYRMWLVRSPVDTPLGMNPRGFSGYVCPNGLR